MTTERSVSSDRPTTDDEKEEMSILRKFVLEFTLLILFNNICDNNRASPIFISGLTK